jgi:hypothetical protein
VGSAPGIRLLAPHLKLQLIELCTQSDELVSLVLHIAFPPPLPLFLLPMLAVRTFDQRTVLDLFSARITAVSLSGYLFFGRWVDVWGRLSSAACKTGPWCDCCCWYCPFFCLMLVPPQCAATKCSSVNVVERVVAIAKSTLEPQPHMQPTAAAPARPPGLPSMPSSATLARTYDNLDAFADTRLGASDGEAGTYAIPRDMKMPAPVCANWWVQVHSHTA